uniref:Uncharacterized protein n=1 Tax=Anguilla anguilla TaxID=7936 RepID=A0A0E9WZ99_ANGAN
MFQCLNCPTILCCIRCCTNDLWLYKNTTTPKFIFISFSTGNLALD